MPESARTLNRWIPTRKTAMVLDLLCDGEVVERLVSGAMGIATDIANKEAGHSISAMIG
ncbi:MAG: hypothetical protein KGL31_12495 [candidate division NC10 bacterium]|nr:hypothetical protein [candidate division NC10 bacterium]MDE2322710.1 hypothetical protein [candidate division NC10 bacterium]